MLRNFAYSGPFARLYNSGTGTALGMSGDISLNNSEFAASLIPECKTLLSIGGGTGEVEDKIARRGVAVVNHDLSRDMLAESRRRGHGAECVNGEGERLPYRDGSFDCVLINESLGHMRPAEALRESLRVLKRGGKLVVNSQKACRHTGFARYLSVTAFSYHFFTREELLAAAGDAGFAGAAVTEFHVQYGCWATPFLRLSATKR
jgi:ubiquinone/menaquinone biosynthesis C-methylase UbiE